jgi:hypothetical protein
MLNCCATLIFRNFVNDIRASKIGFNAYILWSFLNFCLGYEGKGGVLRNATWARCFSKVLVTFLCFPGFNFQFTWSHKHCSPLWCKRGLQWPDCTLSSNRDVKSEQDFFFPLPNSLKILTKEGNSKEKIMCTNKRGLFPEMFINKGGLVP